MPPLRHELTDQKDNIFFRCVEDCYEPIMITDKRGALIYTNKAWSNIYGYSAEEALGETPRLLRSKYQSNHFYQKMWAQIINPEVSSWRGELINIAKDGSEVPVLLNITPYKSSNGETLGYMGLALDLRKQKSLEEQVAQQDRLATIGELTSGLAHEIGTPVGVIRGRAEMLQMQSNSDSPIFKSLEIIIRQADRISSLISSLLRLSRKSNSEPLQNITLANTVRDVEELLVQRLRKHNIKFYQNVPANLMAFADSNKLEQVLINLIVNAIQAIASHCDPEKNDVAQVQRQITVSGELGNNIVQIHIEDNGGGIAPEILEKIFHPFFTTKPTSEGTGLGLAIVYRIMDEMGGFIKVESDPGQGTRFTLTLQAAQP